MSDAFGLVFVGIVGVTLGFLCGLSVAGKGLAFADGCKAAGAFEMVRIDSSYRCLPVERAREIRK
jgi:hypothetical protein